MRLPSWARVRRTRSLPGTLEVDLVMDASGFVAAVRDLQSAERYRRRVAHERSLGQAYVGVLLDGLCHGFGLDPVAAWRLPRQRDELYDRLASPDRVTRQAAEAEWLRVHRAHRAAEQQRRVVE